MSSAAQTPDLDVVQHPTLGTLKFPKDMPYEERNESIQRTLLSHPDAQAPPPVKAPSPPLELDPHVPSYEQASKEAQDYVGRGASLLGGGGIAKIGEEALPIAKPLAKPALRGVGKVASTVGDAMDSAPLGMASPRIPYAGRMLGKVGRIASKLGEEKAVFPGAHLPEAPPIYSGAPLPEHPGVFPGAPLPEHPGVFPGAPLPEHPGVFPGAPLPEHPGVFPGAPLPEHPGVFPGAPLPEVPPSEVLQARPIAVGGKPTPPSSSSALRSIPLRPPGPPHGYIEALDDAAIEDQARAQAEGADHQALEEVARERTNAQMPRKAARLDVIEKANSGPIAVPGKSAGTSETPLLQKPFLKKAKWLEERTKK